MVCSIPVAQVAIKHIKRKCTKVVLKRSKQGTHAVLNCANSILFWLGLAWQILFLAMTTGRPWYWWLRGLRGVSSNASTTVLGVRLSDLIIGKRGNPHFHLATIGLELRSWLSWLLPSDQTTGALEPSKIRESSPTFVSLNDLTGPWRH